MLRKRLILAALAAAPSVAAAQAPTPKAPPKPPAAQPSGAVSEVVVTGEKPAVQTSIDRRSYDVSKDLQAQTGSIGDALRNVPSVEVDVQGNLSVRGDPNVTILVDGKPSAMFEGDNKAQSLQAMPADRIERVEVITNPSAEFRADGTGGVINLITKKARGAGRTATAKLTAANAGRVFASGSLGYNSGKMSAIADANLRHDSQKQISVEDRQTLDPASGGFNGLRQVQDSHSTLDISNFHTAVDYDLTPKTRLSVDLRGNYIDFTIGGPTDVVQTSPAGALTGAFRRDFDVHQLRGNGVGSMTLRRTFGDPSHVLTGNLTYDATNDDRVRKGQTEPAFPEAPDSFDRQNLDYDYRRTQLKADYVRPMGEGSTFKAGIDVQWDDNSYGNTGFRGSSPGALVPDPALTNLFLFEQQIAQAYVTYERPFGDVTVLAGLRLEDVRIDEEQVTEVRQFENDYARAYPSLHLAWKRSESDQLTASYSHRVQRPNPLQYNPFRFLLDPLNYIAGNPFLKPAETRSYEIGYEHRAAPTILLATLYYRDNKNGFAQITQPLGDGTFVTLNANVTKSRSAGLELVANGKLGAKLSYNVSGNLYWTQIDPQPLGSPEQRSATSASGRANLTWQATADDLVQLNGFLNGKQLTPQGYFAPAGGLNLGYRHKFSDRFAFVLTAQDLLGTFKFRSVIDTPMLKSNGRSDFDSRQIQAGFTWTLGGGRPRGPEFEFQNGGGGPPQ